MSVLRKLERFAKYAFYTPLVFIRHGSFRPTRVKIEETGSFIYFDPTDRRAVKKLIYGTARRRVPLPLHFWKDFIEKLDPDFALDVGTNYGECLFGVRYPDHTQVLGCEANPDLMSHVRQSRESHPDHSRIEIANILVSDVDDISQHFYVDPTWTGGASIYKPQEGGESLTRSHLLSTRRLDSLVTSEMCEGRVVLLKMDIEGSEPLAIRGFSKSLEAARLVVGFMEFDTIFMRQVGQDGEVFFNQLKENFDIYYVASVKPCTLQTVLDFKDLPISRAEGGRVHLDLVLVTKGADAAEWLSSRWVVTRLPNCDACTG